MKRWPQPSRTSVFQSQQPIRFTSSTTLRHDRQGQGRSSATTAAMRSRWKWAMKKSLWTAIPATCFGGRIPTSVGSLGHSIHCLRSAAAWKHHRALRWASPWAHRTAGAFWRVISQHKVKTLFTAPTTFRAIKKEDPFSRVQEEYDLSNFKALFLAVSAAIPTPCGGAASNLNVRSSTIGGRRKPAAPFALIASASSNCRSSRGTDRLGTGLPCLLLDDRQGMRIASLRWPRGENSSPTLSGRWSIFTKMDRNPHETQSQHLARRGHHPTAPEERGFCRRVPDEDGPRVLFIALRHLVQARGIEAKHN